MEQGKILYGMVFIGSLLTCTQTKVMGTEVKDISIDESTTVARMGRGDMAPCGMENYRLDKKDWKKDEYFNSVNTNGAYEEWHGMPRHWYFSHSSNGVSYNHIYVLPRAIDEKSVQYIFDKAIYGNYCTSGTEKGVAVTVLFVDDARMKNLVEKYYEKTGVVPTGMLSPATNTQHKEFLEYITKELSEEKVGAVTKVLLESDSSYENESGYLKSFMNQLVEGLQKDNVIAYSVECIPEGPK